MFMRVNAKCAHQVRPPTLCSETHVKVGKGLLKRQATERRGLERRPSPPDAGRASQTVPHVVRSVAGRDPRHYADLKRDVMLDDLI